MKFDYNKICSEFSFDCPADFNFAFDVLAKKALEPNKLALISIDRDGNHVQDVTYKELDQSSSRFANALLSLGVLKTDNILVVLPRIPEWYYVLFGCAKMGAVAMPGTNLLTQNDIEYRLDMQRYHYAVVRGTTWGALLGGAHCYCYCFCNLDA